MSIAINSYAELDTYEGLCDHFHGYGYYNRGHYDGSGHGVGSRCFIVSIADETTDNYIELDNGYGSGVGMDDRGNGDGV